MFARWSISHVSLGMSEKEVLLCLGRPQREQAGFQLGWEHHVYSRVLVQKSLCFDNELQVGFNGGRVVAVVGHDLELNGRMLLGPRASLAAISRVAGQEVRGGSSDADYVDFDFGVARIGETTTSYLIWGDAKQASGANGG